MAQMKKLSIPGNRGIFFRVAFLTLNGICPLFEVSQYDIDGNLVEKSVVIYNKFLSKPNASFVPNAKLKVNFAFKTLSVRLVQAAFDRFLWKEGHRNFGFFAAIARDGDGFFFLADDFEVEVIKRERLRTHREKVD